MSDVRYTGIVRDRSTSRPLGGLIVEAHDHRQRAGTALARAKARGDGRFELSLTTGQVRRLFGEARPLLYFVIRSETAVLASTRDSLVWSATRSGSSTFDVDLARPLRAHVPAQAKHQIEGRVVRADGAAVEGAVVKAFRRTIDAAGVDEEELASDVVELDADGIARYALVLSLPDDDAGAALRLEASLASTPFAEAFVPRLLPRQTLDLVDDGGAAEPTAFARVRRAVADHRPYSFGETSGPLDLDWTVDQVGVAAALSEQDPALVDRLGRAEVLHQLEDGASAEVYFGLLAGGADGDPGRVFTRGRSALRADLQVAVDDGDTARGLDVEAALDDLEVAAGNQLLRTDLVGVTPIGTIVSRVSGETISEADRKTFARLVVKHDGIGDDLWPAVESALGGATAAELQLRIEIGRLAKDHRPMLQALRDVAGVTSTKDLAALTRAEIRALLDGISPAYPEGTPGETDGARKDAFAKEVADRVEEAHRTAFHKKVFAGGTPMRTFLDGNASFSWEGHRVRRYLTENPTAIEVVAEPQRDALIADLERVERLFGITKYSHEVTALEAQGYASALDVHRHGRASFLAKMAPSGLDPSRLESIYEDACFRTAAAHWSLSTLSRATHTELLALPQMHLEVDTPKTASFTELFGSLDACRCEPCQSVLGPSAYLVDLLQFCKRLGGPGSDDGADVLFSRRPDLRHLRLDCPSALTPLPAIDLVNEALEVRLAMLVASDTFPDDWPTTTVRTAGTAEEVAALPEPVHQSLRNAAYEHLRGRVFPFGTPYDAWLDEAAILFEHLGVPREALARALAPASVLPDEMTSADVVAMLRLGVARKAFAILDGTDASDAAALWGFASGHVIALADVPTMLEKSGLSYDELRELVATSWAESEGITIEGETCKLAELGLAGLTSGNLALMQRLLRLRRATGMSISALDRARAALFPTLDTAALRSFATAWALARRLDVRLDAALGWWAPLSTWAAWEPSPFAKLFLDKSALHPFDADLAALVDTPGGAGVELKELRPALLAGLRLRERDLALLLPLDGGGSAITDVEELALVAVLHSQEVLTLANVSRLERHVSLARALRLPLAELLLLRALSGSAPLAGDAGHMGPASTEAFVDLVERVRAGSLSVADIDYILRDRPYPGLRPDTTTPWLGELVVAFERILADTSGIEDPSGERTQALLEEAFGAGATEVGEVFAAIAAESPGPTEETAVADHLPPFVESTPALMDALFGTNRLALADRWAYVARRLARWVAARAFVRTWAAATFGVGVEIARFLLEERLTWTPDGGSAETAIGALLPGAQPTEPRALDTAPDTASVDAILRRLHKVALLTQRLRLSTEQVELLFRSDALGSLPLLDPNALPTTPALPSDPLPTSAFTALLRMVDVAALGARLPGGPDALERLLRAFVRGKKPALPAHPFDLSPPPVPLTDRDAALAELALATGWDLRDLVLLADRFGVATKLELTDVDQLLRLERAVEALGRLGASAEEGIAWVTFPDDEVVLEVPLRTRSHERTARDLRRLVRARYGSEEAWSEATRSLRDPLRERQRAALVATLVDALPGVGAPSDLFAQMLMDVEVTAAPKTSRIVQASATVQTFVQRALLGLEGDVTVEADTAAAWKWMRSYRVWEANRKVFLYPESYLVPELRDDKTPLFQQLETFLLQGEMSDERAEEAIRGYLAGLEEISHLRPVALCRTDAGDIHLVGSSPSPARLFYRARIRGRWRPWEVLEVEVEGDQHLAVLETRGRVFLFWLTIEEVRSRHQSSEQGAPSLLENRIRLHFVEKIDGGWSKRRSSEPHAFGARNFPRYFRLGLVADGSGRILADVGVSSGTSSKFHRRIATWRVDPTRGSVRREAHGYCSPDRALVRNETDEWVLIEDAPGHLSEAVLDASHRRARMTARGQLESSMESASSVAVEVDADDFQDVFADIDAVGQFEVVAQAHRLQDEADRTTVAFRDPWRSFLVERVERTPFRPEAGTQVFLQGQRDYVRTHAGRCTLLSHDLAATFRDAMAAGGLEGLLGWSGASPPQAAAPVDLGPFYGPTGFFAASHRFPKQEVDFRQGTPFGTYNWELFFHVPLLVATRLARARRHEEALRWFHFIFDPTDGSSDAAPQKYWKVKPFRELRDLDDVAADLEALAEGQVSDDDWIRNLQSVVGDDADGAAGIAAQISEWSRDPFDPHAIARLRPLAYMKAVVEAYVRNLLDWGDQLFARDTLESVNEATQLYVHAADLLGPRPVFVEPPQSPVRKTYAQLEGNLDAFSNALVAAEQTFTRTRPTFGRCGGVPLPDSVWSRLYFCIPPNEKLLALWDHVEDRLFKIRHGLSLEGVARTLPLFAPPIDPALLVAAAAAGLDLSTVVGDLQASAPQFRFSVLLAKAQELTAGVVALGQSLLGAMEKRDGEALANLRQTHEVDMQRSVRAVRAEQVKEAAATLAALEASKAPVEARLDFYANAVEISPAEHQALAVLREGQGHLNVAADLRWQAKGAAALPDVVLGVAGMGSASWGEIGGSLGVSALEMLAGVKEAQGSRLVAEGGNLATKAGYERRFEDFQREKAALTAELAAIDKQILAAKLRLAIAEHELGLVEKQIDQAREVQDLLLSKFTNERLYDWMVGQTAAVYFQSYQLARDVAKRAERAFQIERGDDGQRFIGVGHWEGIRQGLLAGERLALDLRRIDAAYVAQHRREHELTKTVSLLQHDPIQLLRLREEGEAALTVTEAHFDRDHPTHYLRRLKSVSATLSCVTGYAQGVSARLTLHRSETRLTATAEPVERRSAVHGIVTSTGQGDAGLFEIDLKDQVLLPFEGAGAHAPEGLQAQWTFELSPGCELPRASIDDLVLQLRYTARDGRAAQDPHVAPRWRTFRLRTQQPDVWAAFLEGGGAMTFPVTSADLPRPPGGSFDAQEVIVAVKKAGTAPSPWGTAITLGSLTPTLAAGAGVGTYATFEAALSAPIGNAVGDLSLSFGTWADDAGERAAVEEVWIFVRYGAEA